MRLGANLVDVLRIPNSRHPTTVTGWGVYKRQGVPRAQRKARAIVIARLHRQLELIAARALAHGPDLVVRVEERVRQEQWTPTRERTRAAAAADAPRAAVNRRDR